MIFADTLNHRVRRVDSVTHTVATIAGVGVAGLVVEGARANASTISYPGNICIGASGVYFDGPGNLTHIETSTGLISTFATNVDGCSLHPATGGLFSTMAGMRVVAFSTVTTASPTPSAPPSPTATSSGSGSGSKSGPGTQSPSGSRSGTPTATRSSSSTATAAGTGTPSSSQSGTDKATSSVMLSSSPTPTATSTQSLCRAPVNRVAVQSGVSGTFPVASSADAGNAGMYTSGSCAVGYQSFVPGPRLVYRITLSNELPVGGTLTLSTCGLTSNDTVLYLGTGCPTWFGSFNCLRGNDDAVVGAAICAGNHLASALSYITTSRLYFVQLGTSSGAEVVSGLSWSYRTASASSTSTCTRSRTALSTRTRSATSSKSRSRKAKQMVA